MTDPVYCLNINSMDLPFHRIINRWFQSSLGSPTAVQTMAWKEIAKGGHCLLTAPTGSGKTLAAFLWSIHSLITGQEKKEGISVLYISPLKALNNDIRRNLETPLKELEQLFHEAEKPFPTITTAIRSGDTPSYERQKMYRHPPDIFITTPESLHILLTSVKGRNFLQGIKTVILDEIHGLLESRRGVLLTTALERLALTNGEFQRIGLSATVHPMERAAAFMGGYRPMGDQGLVPRQVRLIRDRGNKQYDISIIAPPPDEEEERWAGIAKTCLALINSARSTLFFTDSRRVTEKASRLINDLAGETLAWAHHGSLSRELRFQVEQKMKAGELRAIVATSSLEMGIDIGSLDQVVLLQSPSNQNSMLQRIGRAGHQVGVVSRAVMVPMHPAELIQSAALMTALKEGLQEEIHPLINPLDVLAQLILSITNDSLWQEERLYSLLLQTWNYHNLPRRHFDLVLEMLEGRYSGTTLKELQPRIIRNRLEGTVKAREKGAWLIYTSGGVIPDRGYYDLRTHQGMVKIGELDEEFVWERNPGESFTLGNQIWKILKITDQFVEVTPARGLINIVPFWKAEDQNRSSLLSRTMGEILDQAEKANLSDSLIPRWEESFRFSRESCDELMGYLRLQREKTGIPLPGYRHLVFELCRDNGGGEITQQMIIHSLRGGGVNQPLAIALVQGWKKKTGVELPYFVNNDGITLLTSGPVDPEELLAQVTPENLLELIRMGLRSTPFFGSRFRECAGRSLLLPRQNIKKRTPLWLNRLRSRKLLERVSTYDDFPILLETWRTSLEDHFDIPEVTRLLEQLASKEVGWTLCRSKHPSPFASSLVWRQINLHMYQDDTPIGGTGPTLSDRLLKELIQSSQLRPRVPGELSALLEQRLQRLLPGYGADSPEELQLWLDQRCIMPLEEWKAFLERSAADSELTEAELTAPLNDSICTEKGLVWLKQNQDQRDLLQNPQSDPEQRQNRLMQILSYYGPRSLEEIGSLYGIEKQISSLAAPSLEEGSLILDRIIQGNETLYCITAENLEYLLRMARREREVLHSPRPLEDLPLMIAQRQQLLNRGGDSRDLQPLLDGLIGLPLPAESLEETLLPCRFQWYNPQWFDHLLQESGLIVRGEGEKRFTLLFPDEISLWCSPLVDEEPPLIPQGSFDFFQLKEHWAKNSRETADLLWKGFWQGRWSNHQFQAFRKGIENRFQLPEERSDQTGLSRGRRQMGRWSASRPIEGYWFSLPKPEESHDSMEEMERCRERVRQLLTRYGIVSRELLQKEHPLLSWRKLFPAMRMMELSGELLSGQFFQGLRGMQFTTAEFLKEWEHLEEGQNSLWFINARDPASLCGGNILPREMDLPSRIAGNWLVYRGSRLLMVLEKKGTRCNCRFDSREKIDFSPFWETLLCREIRPLKKIVLKEINRVPAEDSEYGNFFREQGFRKSGGTLILRREY